MKEEGGLLFYDSWIEAQTARAKAWEGTDHPDVKFPVSFYTAELIGEIGEACNVIKKLHREKMGAPGSRDTFSHLAEELADCLICLRNLAVKTGIAKTMPPTSIIQLNTDALINMATLLGIWSGQVCSDAYYLGKVSPDQLAESLSKLEALIRATASLAWIFDFDELVQNKWNNTSEKNGFPHRMQLIKTLSETF